MRKPRKVISLFHFTDSPVKLSLDTARTRHPASATSYLRLAGLQLGAAWGSNLQGRPRDIWCREVKSTMYLGDYGLMSRRNA